LVGHVLLKVLMKNCGIGLKGIKKNFMFHLEMVMTKGLSQFFWECLQMFQKMMDGKFLGGWIQDTMVQYQ
jgi:hypothetical protein